VNKLRAWYDGLKERERRFVLYGGIGLGVVVLVLGILMPLESAVSNATSRSQERREDLEWMRVNAPTVRAGAAQLLLDTGEPPVVLVDRVGQEAGLASSFRGSQPSGSTGVRVQLEAAPFDTLIEWLATLEQRHGLRIEAITIDRTAKPGLVNASVTLNQSQH
jgi:general secretion pathway protein M